MTNSRATGPQSARCQKIKMERNKVKLYHRPKMKHFPGQAPKQSCSREHLKDLALPYAISLFTPPSLLFSFHLRMKKMAAEEGSKETAWNQWTPYSLSRSKKGDPLLKLDYAQVIEL